MRMKKIFESDMPSPGSRGAKRQASLRAQHQERMVHKEKAGHYARKATEHRDLSEHHYEERNMHQPVSMAYEAHNRLYHNHAAVADDYEDLSSIHHGMWHEGANKRK